MSIERIKAIIESKDKEESKIRTQYTLGSYEYQDKAIMKAILELNDKIEALEKKIQN